MKRFLVALYIISIILQLALAPAYAIKYPVEIYYKSVYENNLSSADYCSGYYNEYGYSYIAWYSITDKRFKIIYPDNNYQEKTLNVTIASENYILGPYKNYIIYYGISGSTNTFYKLDINTGQVTTIYNA